MKTFTHKEYKEYLEEIINLRMPLSKHQISKSFFDGIFGHAYINNKSSAIIVFDFVELIGPFDEEIYTKIIEIKESHIVIPPDEWVKEIRNRFTGTYSEYIRKAFKPLVCNEPNIIEVGNRTKSIYINGRRISIRPITRQIAEELLKEEWSKDIVINTMVNKEIINSGYGFVAYLDKKIVGGIGCYTLYKDGIEIEIDTHIDYRRKGVATELSKQMILECKKRSMKCYWDAMNTESALLAEKLGFKKINNYLCLQLNKK